MIRKALTAAAATLLVLSIVPQAFAQARKRSWEVGYFAGANFYANELKIENAFTYGVRLGYNITPALEIEVTWAGSDEGDIQRASSVLIAEHPPSSFVFTNGLTAKQSSYNLRVVGNFSNDWHRWKPLTFIGA